MNSHHDSMHRWHQRSYDDDPGHDASQAMTNLNLRRFEAAEEFIRASDIIRELARAGHPPTEPDRFRMTDALQSYDTLTRAYRVMVP